MKKYKNASKRIAHHSNMHWQKNRQPSINWLNEWFISYSYCAYKIVEKDIWLSVLVYCPNRRMLEKKFIIRLLLFCHFVWINKLTFNYIIHMINYTKYLCMRKYCIKLNRKRVQRGNTCGKTILPKYNLNVYLFQGENFLNKTILFYLSFS
jgi:hypothetical protein